MMYDATPALCDISRPRCNQSKPSEQTDSEASHPKVPSRTAQTTHSANISSERAGQEEEVYQDQSCLLAAQRRSCMEPRALAWS
eukprot:7929-Rhodomonas_salina.1